MDLRDVMYERGAFWVWRQNGLFYVMIVAPAGSASESAYGSLELAVSRCDYLASRKQEAPRD